MSRRRLDAVVLIGLALLACAACKPSEPPGTDRSLTAAMLEVDPSPDPALVAWGGCLDAVTQCLEGGGEIRQCASAERCGADCAAALDRALVGASGREAQLDAFESVFINPDAVCRPKSRSRP